jgi:ABC-type multidrug transport system ATPase subunit
VHSDEPCAIRVSGLVRRFRGKTALAGVDLSVCRGQIHALLGPNGAGKTTLTRVVCGLVDPDEGAVETSGSVALVPSGDRTFYLRISGLENLIFFGRLHGMRLHAARARAEEVLDEVDLVEAASLAVGRYSHGMQKRLSVARALLARPSALLVDEATHDLDPEGARRIRALVAMLAGRGTAVLWTTQRVEEIRDFAHAVTFLHRGTVRFTGSVNDLIVQAPDRHYIVQVRNGDRNHAPDVRVLQRSLGTLARISEETGEDGHFMLRPAPHVVLGSAIAVLAEYGFEVISCRQERAEIEGAFLALAQEPAV